MGKFQLKALRKRKKEIEKNRRKNIKESLRKKALLEPLPSPLLSSSILEDGILLFGAHKNEKISDLLSDFRSAAYVLEYLAKDKMLPSKFKKQIRTIIDNYDPFEIESSDSKYNDFVKEVPVHDWKDDDIPF